MKVPLTPQFVAAAVAQPGADRTIYWDSTLRGFGLQVTAAGHKSFVCQYRNAQGRSKRMAIKATLKLGEARKEARALLGEVAKGGDPLTERRKDAARATNTLQSVAEEYFQREGTKLRTSRHRQVTLTRLVYPTLGSRQIEDVRRSDLVRLLDKIEDGHGPVMADRTLAYLRRVFSWHATRDDDFRSPIVRGMARTKPAERARIRVLNDDEIRSIWKAAGETSSVFGSFIKFLMLTASRRDEAARLRRSEVEGDLWIIPAARSKSKKETTRPLSKPAQSIIASVPRVGNSDLVFSGDGKRAIGGFSQCKRAFDRLSGVTGWRLHDARRTARSLMSRAGINADIAERCLGHVIGGVRGTYDRHAYVPEMRAAFEALAAEITRIVGTL